ncbi:MAG: spoIIIJ-associated protein [Bacillota bacterium]|nr:spoIIIJ-associated protein [Bacillota bacterium]
MKSVEETGRTVDEAVAQALRKLELPRDRVEVEVLEEGSRGLLGILGSRPARVRVSVRPQAVEQAREFMENVVRVLGIAAKVSAVQGAEALEVEVEGEDVGALIGRRGHSLDAWQYLVSLAANKGVERPVRVLLDVAGYRRRRKAALENLARRTAERVKTRKRSVALEAMPPAERRIIHLALQDDPDVITLSEGRDPYRRVVISLRGREREARGPQAGEEKE